VNSLSSPTNNLILGSSDQNPGREVRSIVSNLEWELGDTVQLSCAGAPFLFSQGVKWALEMKDGNLEFQKDCKNVLNFFNWKIIDFQQCFSNF
jgi:hypothetical protein